MMMPSSGGGALDDTEAIRQRIVISDLNVESKSGSTSKQGRYTGDGSKKTKKKKKVKLGMLGEDIVSASPDQLSDGGSWNSNRGSAMVVDLSA